MSLPLNSNQLLTSVTEGVNRLDTDESVHVGITVFSRDVNLSVRQSTGFTLRSAGGRTSVSQAADSWASIHGKWRGRECQRPWPCDCCIDRLQVVVDIRRRTRPAVGPYPLIANLLATGWGQPRPDASPPGMPRQLKLFGASWQVRGITGADPPLTRH
jgi:hypothetical protein